MTLRHELNSLFWFWFWRIIFAICFFIYVFIDDFIFRKNAEIAGLKEELRIERKRNRENREREE